MKKKTGNPFAGVARLPLELPEFANEAEEARWWDAHPEVVQRLFDRAHAAGAIVRMRGDKQVPGTTQTTIRLITADVERAREIARRKGLRYQTYLKMLIHEALEREAKAG